VTLGGTWVSAISLDGIARSLNMATRSLCNAPPIARGNSTDRLAECTTRPLGEARGMDGGGAQWLDKSTFARSVNYQ